MSTHIPHPERQLSQRIAALEARHPEVMVWTPLQSVSGKWEALADGWDEPIQDSNPSRFCARLAARLDPPKPKDVPGGSSPLPSPGDPRQGQ